MGRKSAVSTEKRSEAVLALLRREESNAQIARRYGVSEQTLVRWRDEFLEGGKLRLKGKAIDADMSREIARLQREVESREQVIGELTVANRILKKLSGPSL